MIAKPTLADIGLQASAADHLPYDHALRLARTLDREDASLDDGLLPLTWIWAFFAPRHPTAALRDDGHPECRSDGPLAGLERRMFIGGGFDRLGPVHLDRLTHRTSRVVGAEKKMGSTGEFMLVQVEHRYEQSQGAALIERQDLMYRAASQQRVSPPGTVTDAPPSAGFRHDLRPDQRLLFRYSALTFNTHRIHYDADFARDVEGYPDLVVHGPLTATLLCDLASRQLGAPPDTFSFRASAPTFVGVPLSIVCDAPISDRQLQVRAVRGDGVTAMTGTAAVMH